RASAETDQAPARTVVATFSNNLLGTWRKPTAAPGAMRFERLSMTIERSSACAASGGAAGRRPTNECSVGEVGGLAGGAQTSLRRAADIECPIGLCRTGCR